MCRGRFARRGAYIRQQPNSHCPQWSRVEPVSRPSSHLSHRQLQASSSSGGLPEASLGATLCVVVIIAITLLGETILIYLIASVRCGQIGNIRSLSLVVYFPK